MTYKEIVTLIKNISEAINPDGSFFHGRTYDTTLEFAAIYPQIHLYPFTMQPEQSNINIIRSELLIAFWKEDGHENTMAQREDIIAAMDDLCVLFEAAIRATENVQVLSFRKEPQYLSQMGVVSGIACNISLHSAVLCAGPTEQAPVNLTLPLITGLNTLGATLSGSNGTWSGNPDTFTYTYQWKRDGVNISGATNNTYVTTVLDSEAEITFEVTANNGVSPNGVATSLGVMMADYTPVNTLAPVISGTTSLGSTLTGTNGSWTNSPSIFSYQWKRNGINISGATNNTYVLTLADQSSDITLEVSGSNGLVGSQISNTLSIPSFAPTVTGVSISGSAVVDQVLTASYTLGGGTATTITRRWYRGATLIFTSTTVDTYTLVQADAGNTSNIKCVVDADNVAGTASADSNTIAQILDADMKSWLIDNVGIQNDSTTYFTSTRQRTGAQLVSYYNDFYIGLKSNNIYSAIRAMYRPRFANSLLNRFNMVNPATYLMVYSGTWTYQETGELPNGVNASCTGGLAVNVMGQNSITIGVDLYTAGTAGNRVDVSGDSSSVYIAARYDAGPILGNSISNVNNTGLKTVTNSGVIAFWLATRTVSTERRLYKNSTLIDTFIATSTTPVSTNIIFGRGAAGVDFCDRGQRFRIVADGLTGAQITALNTLLATLTTSEGI